MCHELDSEDLETLDDAIATDTRWLSICGLAFGLKNAWAI